MTGNTWARLFLARCAREEASAYEQTTHQHVELIKLAEGLESGPKRAAAEQCKSQALRAAVFALLSNSVEAYQLIGPAAKPAHEYDEYDVMMAPIWRAVYDACDHVGAALPGAPAAPKEHK